MAISINDNGVEGRVTVKWCEGVYLEAFGPENDMIILRLSKNPAEQAERIDVRKLDGVLISLKGIESIDQFLGALHQLRNMMAVGGSISGWPMVGPTGQA